MGVRPMTRRTGFSENEMICHWCGLPIVNPGFRSPIPDIPGGRYVVCGPLCLERPLGAPVLFVEHSA